RRAFMGRARSVTNQSGVSGDANEHRIAFEDGAFSAPKWQPQRLRERMRHQDALDVRYFHWCRMTRQNCAAPLERIRGGKASSRAKSKVRTALKYGVPRRSVLLRSDHHHAIELGTAR